MNKSDLIEIMAERSGITQATAEKIFQTIYEAMKENMLAGGRIEIRGFGSFCIKEYGGYRGRNPKTGELIAVKPKRLPFFRPGKELKHRVDSYRPKSAEESPESED